MPILTNSFTETFNGSIFNDNPWLMEQLRISWEQRQNKEQRDLEGDEVYRKRRIASVVLSMQFQSVAIAEPVFSFWAFAGLTQVDSPEVTLQQQETGQTSTLTLSNTGTAGVLSDVWDVQDIDIRLPGDGTAKILCSLQQIGEWENVAGLIP